MYHEGDHTASVATPEFSLTAAELPGKHDIEPIDGPELSRGLSSIKRGVDSVPLFLFALPAPANRLLVAALFAAFPGGLRAPLT
jgi:hypothetical protein